jgi:leader peptidase (prepilin peptidase)/N-methyltransferase
MLPWFIAVCGLFGLLIGSFLNVVVWRVPRGESLLPGSRCPNCDAAIRPWQNVPVLSWLALRGRCANCRARISARYPLVELGAGVAFALVAWWYGAAFEASFTQGPLAQTSWWLTLVAYLWFAAISIALTLIDLDHRRLPDAIVLPSLAVVAILLALAAIFVGDWGRLVATIAAAAVLFTLYVIIALVHPKGIGGGDVKLAPLIGATLGFLGWGAVAVGAFAGFLLGAIYGLGLIALRRATRKTGIPFGPFMLVGAWIGIVWGEAIMASYLGLFGLG